MRRLSSFFSRFRLRCSRPPVAAAVAARQTGLGDAAVVGGEHITRDQLDTRVHEAKCSYDLQKRTFPKAGSAEYQAIQCQILASLVQRIQLEQKAPSLGVKVTTTMSRSSSTN